MNALFLDDLKKKTRRGKRGRIEVGESVGGLAYGYEVVKGMNKNGEPITGERRNAQGTRTGRQADQGRDR